MWKEVEVSSDYFAVDTDALAKSAPEVRAFSDQMKQVVTRLQTRLDELGGCWGDDPMGKSFEDAYLTPRDEMIEGLKGIADVLDSTADGLETMAKGLHQTEEASTAAARSFERGNSNHSGSPVDRTTPGGSHGHNRSRV